MTLPRVSVVMPVLNGQRYLGPAIESILGQTFHDFEFLVVNDGSTDRSVEIIREYAARDSRVLLLENRCHGIAEALNAGCRAAKGRFIARMDCDDIAYPDRLARQVAFLEGQEHVAVVGGAALLIDADGRPLSELRYTPENASLREKLLTGCWVIHPTVMMRSEMLWEVGGYRQACFPAEDYDLWLRLSDHHLVLNMPGAALIKFRTHGDQVSNTKRRRQVISGMAAQRATLARRQTGRDPIDAIHEVDDMAARALGITEAEIDRQFIDTVSLKALNAVRLGTKSSVDEARALMDGLVTEALSPAGRAYLLQKLGDFELTAQLEMIRGLVATHRYCAAAIRVVGAGIRGPTIVARAIVSLLRRLRP